MMSLYETLKQDIPILEKQFGSDSQFVQQLKQQLADIAKEPDPEKTHPETEEYHAMIIPNQRS